MIWQCHYKDIKGSKTHGYDSDNNIRYCNELMAALIVDENRNQMDITIDN